MARNGMVTTSQPLAAQAGLRILKEGGNAVDASIAVAATLNLEFDVARFVHPDIARTQKFARLWGSGAFDGQQVGPEYRVADGGPRAALQTISIESPGQHRLPRAFGVQPLKRFPAQASLLWASSSRALDDRVAGSAAGARSQTLVLRPCAPFSSPAAKRIVRST
jgi:hypothetical protein